MSPVSPAADPRESSDEISRGYANYVLGALFVAYSLNFVDRQVLSVLLVPIQTELQVSDTAMGLLTGLAFALFYTFAGIPIARWADRGNRRSIIAIGFVVWSVMTAVSGLARSYAQLALARMGVGVGEATFGPAAQSLISDYFPPERRATALAIFTIGANVGSLVGLIGGGYLYDLFGWRTAFFVVGLPGVLFALVFRLTVREPRRGLAEGIVVAPSSDSTWDVLRYLMVRSSFVYIAAAAALHGFAGYGAGAWTPAFMIRVHGLSPGQAGLALGLVSGVFAGLGAYLGGKLSDGLGRRDVRWNMWVPALGSVLAFPFSYLFLLWPDTLPALAFLVPSAILGGFWVGPTYAMTQGLARPHMRALAVAILLFILNLIGMGLGPLVVGILNDVLEPRLGIEAVRYSLLIVAVPHVLAAVFNLLAARTLRADMAQPASSTSTPGGAVSGA